ncbi:MAG: redox-regulated ATPase YchF [Omnitrophica bacterium RIFCSPLOWO2_02_FULL_45_16]|nr:MAG: redox-regulated ATPase YchF [Omnitrophica bacterium RIFCSPHIGHO2_02_FULL_46_20]OGX01446.1 MAG: redox-regulated ATPase YchF [Omnitrophica bacterium RIFCSPLOWO2_02_FULL_45_16]
MKIGIIGLPQTGKKALFELLTGHKPSENEVASGKPIHGIAEIRDSRFDYLVGMYKPKKEVRARIEIELLPKIEKDAISKGEIFEDIAQLDALCHVVRAFKDESIYHVSGSVDPSRDIDAINSELILHDLIFIEKRSERLDKKVKQTKEEASIKEKGLLAKLKAHLDKELPLRLLELNADEKKAIAGYPFLTRKEMIRVLNVSEGQLKERQLVKGSMDEAATANTMRVSAKVEAEVAGLESERERKEFLAALGIDEPAINILTRLCLGALKLVSFFTVGPDEVRQWNVRAGSTAVEAAGAIHSDLQKGFIRAELIKFDDIKKLGGEDAVKAQGKFYLKGKEYIVEDGDILSIRFNV